MFRLFAETSKISRKVLNAQYLKCLTPRFVIENYCMSGILKAKETCNHKNCYKLPDVQDVISPTPVSVNSL